MKLIAAIAFVVLLTGCTQHFVRNQHRSYAIAHVVKHYSGGKLIGEWESRGEVLNGDFGDSWYFEDTKTGELIELTGDVQVLEKH